ncbi:unnamed protein product [Adineta ricciae]|uniref:Protein-tyrosine-phosphatase n=1 Tax=Adineta ricciae TaxID=249248 RepID=A0A814I5F1_ADIRI|nr:unnamed protein product [Adineta ricciae]
MDHKDFFVTDNGKAYGGVEKETKYSTNGLSVMTVSASYYSIFIYKNDTLYHSIGLQHKVFKIVLSSSTIGPTIAADGNGTARSQADTLNNPHGIYIDDDFSLYVSDCYNEPNTSTAPEYGASGTTNINYPTRVLLDADGYLFYYRCNSPGSSDAELNYPYGFSFDTNGLADSHCETKVNFYENVTCFNWGVCQSLLLKYTCQCLVTSYWDRHCDLNSKETIALQIVSKSFASVAIFIIIITVIFILIMDILKSCFNIDPTSKKSPRIKRRKRATIVQYVYIRSSSTDGTVVYTYKNNCSLSNNSSLIISDLKTPLYRCRIPEVLPNNEIHGVCRHAWNDTRRNSFHHDGVHINNITDDSFVLELIDSSHVDPRNHVHQCNRSNLPDGCIYTCLNVELHSIYQVSLITPGVSQFSYDYIDLRCSTEDAFCFEQHWLSNITIGCHHCDHISLFPITRGVKYNCIAYTVKNNIFLAASNDFPFETILEPVLYNLSSQINASSVYLNFIPQSDFTSVTLVCSSHLSTPGSCPSISTTSYSCSKNLIFNGTLGCDYQCYFKTVKSYYDDRYSNMYILSFLPPKPRIHTDDKNSTWISVTWSLDNNVYVHSFDLFINSINFPNIDHSYRSHYFPNLSPNKMYEIYIRLNANHQVESDRIYVKTLEDAPLHPSSTDIFNKIVPWSHGPLSTTEQIEITIDLSLFSHDYGFVHHYMIYVRQDQWRYSAVPYMNGTYAEAWNNPSIDYLAAVIPVYSQDKQSETHKLILGSEVGCYYSSPCNGKLKQNTDYKIIVGGCSKGGCTYVISRSFRTYVPYDDPESAKSIAWVAVFPGVAVLIVIIGLLICKRKAIKKCCCRRTNKSDSNAVKADFHDIKPTVSPNEYACSEMQPKLLVDYISLTDENKQNLINQFQELQNLEPKYDARHQKWTDDLYDRYSDIPSRGPWSKTAVHLTGQHRQHDYINANEIRGIHSPKQYIACQGPLENTCEDFWDMVMQYEVTKIVMLSIFDQLKCYPYIPMKKNQSLHFGKIKIETKDIQHHLNNQLETRQLLVKRGNTVLHVMHYLYTNWSGFAVIDSQSVLDLIEIVNQTTTFPIVVHCSSGTGRTGTYIAIDIIIHLLNQSNVDLSTMKLDVMGIVNQLKHERIHMVQTPEQYLLIHSCIEDYLKKQNRLSFLARGSHLYERINDNLTDAADEQCLDLDQAQNVQYDNITIATKKLSGTYCIPNDDSYYTKSSVDNDPTQITIKNF